MIVSSIGCMNERRLKLLLVLIGALNGPSLATVPAAPLFKQQSKS
jgi:hypothetical protein